MELLSNLYVQIGLSAIIILLVLNLITLVWVWRLSSHYNQMTEGIDQPTLKKILEQMKRIITLQNKSITRLDDDVKWLKDEGKAHLQKLTLMRYNPFSDTGGDQSFILGILDGKDNGLVITSLHSRENTRIYVKKVIAGKGAEHPLSDEEKKVLSGKPVR